jgi:hypothetical protein
VCVCVHVYVYVMQEDVSESLGPKGENEKRDNQEKQVTGRLTRESEINRQKAETVRQTDTDPCICVNTSMAFEISCQTAVTAASGLLFARPINTNERHRQRQRQRHRHRQRQRQRQREREEKERQTDRQTDRQTQRQTQRHTTHLREHLHGV